MVDRYAIRDGYTIRPEPEYFNDDLGGVIWQPDVYGDAGRVAARLGASRIIDVGAGDGTKLADLRATFDLIGIDFGGNVDRSEERFPYITWRRHDLDTEEPLPLGVAELDRSVIVCSDVIEHLRAPHLLLRKLRAALDHASAILISTPERELWHGVRSCGPPRNVHHVREWSIREFGLLLGANGFENVSVGLTRANDRTDEAFTIEALIARNATILEELIPVLIDRPIPPARRRWLARWIRAARIIRHG